MPSSSSVGVEILLKVKDAATAGIKATGEVSRTEAEKTANATERAAQRAAQATERSAALQRGSAERLSKARESLGIRPERVIQEEIKNTQRAYGQLAAAGFASAQEQERAYAATQRRITALTNEMGRLTVAQQRATQEAKRLEEIEARKQRGQQVLRTGAAAVVGAGAAAYTLVDPAKRTMSFDERLAHMANTAFNDRDTAGRKIGMKELETAVVAATGKGGGGTREQAAEALDLMIASGAMKPDQAIKMLPQIMRYSAASGANASELAGIGIRAMQTFKIDAADMPNVMNMAIAAGQAGGFELKDMSKWLPQQMAAATMSGMSGKEGFAKLAALNQAAAITAGNKDEAGNNVVNLLAKINSNDTANDAKKLGYNLPKYLQEQRAKGVDSVDAFSALVDKTVAGRADYQALQKQLKSAKTDEDKKATLESMATIAQGAGIGKLIQDRQAMMALLGLMNNREYLQDVLGKVKANDLASGGAGDKNYEMIAETAAFKVRQAEQAKDASQKVVMDELTPAIGKAADAFVDLATKYPVLTGATTLATVAIGAMAGSAVLASVAMGGKNPLTENLGRIFGGATAPAGRIATMGNSVSKLVSANPMGLAAAPLAAMYNVSEWAGDTSQDTQRVASRLSIGNTIEKMLAMFGFDKQAEIERRRAEMRAELEVIVKDDRVYVSNSKLSGDGVSASLKAGSSAGNIHAGAPY